MSLRSLHKTLIPAILLMAVAGLRAADAPAGDKPAKPEKPATANGDVQKRIDEVRKQSSRILANHEELKKKLEGATEAQRKEILKKMQEQMDEARQLGNQIRDELRKLRESQGKGPR